MSVNVSLTYHRRYTKKRDLRNISNNFIDFVNLLDNFGCENFLLLHSPYMPLAHAIAKDVIKEREYVQSLNKSNGWNDAEAILE